MDMPEEGWDVPDLSDWGWGREGRTRGGADPAMA